MLRLYLVELRRPVRKRGLGQKRILHLTIITLVYFSEQVVGLRIVPECPEHEAYVHIDASVVVFRPAHVPGERLFVAVEGESHQFSPGVEHRRAGVAAGDVVVAEEVHRQVVAIRDGFLQERSPFRQEVEVVAVVLLGEYLGGEGLPREHLPSAFIALDIAPGDAHRGVGVRVLWDAFRLTEAVEGRGVFALHGADAPAAFGRLDFLVEVRDADIGEELVDAVVAGHLRVGPEPFRYGVPVLAETLVHLFLERAPEAPADIFVVILHAVAEEFLLQAHVEGGVFCRFVPFGLVLEAGGDEGESGAADHGLPVPDDVLLGLADGLVFLAELLGQGPALLVEAALEGFLLFDHPESAAALLQALIVLLDIAQGEVAVGVFEPHLRVGVHPFLHYRHLVGPDLVGDREGDGQHVIDLG